MHVQLQMREALRQRAGRTGMIQVNVGDRDGLQVGGIESCLPDPLNHVLDGRRRTCFDQRGALTQQQVDADRTGSADVVRVDEDEVFGEPPDARHVYHDIIE